METTTFARRIELAGCSNFRDLGGYASKFGGRTQWRRVFRSDSLHHLTDADIQTLVSQEIRLKSGFDLRSIGEIEMLGIGSIYDHGVWYNHAPFVRAVGGDNSDLNGDLVAFYFRMLDEAQGCVRQVFYAFASPATFPAVFYCAAGKDRTGMMSAILLKALGVSHEDIVADYLLMEALTLERLQERLKAQGKDLPLALIRPQAETMQRFLSEFDARYVSVERYLGSCGIGGDTISAIRTHLLGS